MALNNPSSVNVCPVPVFDRGILGNADMDIGAMERRGGRIGAGTLRYAERAMRRLVG
jgi:hypothetical protein